MYKGIVVTPRGPCLVEKSLYKDIVAKKNDDAYFGMQILLALEFNLDDATKFVIKFGDLPMVKTMADFVNEYITQGRSIMPDDS